MTSRERVLQAMNFRQPAQVAIDFGGHHSSSIMALAYKRLRDYLALPKRPIRVYDIPQQLAVIDDDVLERFHVDTVDLGRTLHLEEPGWRPWRLPDGTECLIPDYIDVEREDGAWVIHHADGTPIAVQRDGMIYFEQTHWALADHPEEKLDRLEELFRYNIWMALPAPVNHIPFDEPGLARLATYARRVRESEQRAILGIFGGSLFESGQMLWGIPNFMQALALQPELVDRYLDAMVLIYKRDLGRFLGAVGPFIDIVVFSDDYGMQTGSQISPEMFRRFFKARHQELWQYAKKKASVKVMLHSCGSIANLLPDMIEAGLDIVQPVQTSSKNMQAAALKSQFGKQLVLWGGGCDTQRVLGMGTPADVRQNVFDNLDVLAPGGGFVFQQVHNIMANVPPENIVAMFDAVAEWNRLHPS